MFEGAIRLEKWLFEAFLGHIFATGLDFHAILEVPRDVAPQAEVVRPIGAPHGWFVALAGLSRCRSWGLDMAFTCETRLKPSKTAHLTQAGAL